MFKKLEKLTQIEKLFTICIVIFILFFISTISANIVNNLNDKKISKIQNNIINYQNRDSLNEAIYKDSISNLLLKFRIKYPNIVLAQAIVESGHFKDKVFRENHNPFGMKMPTDRASTALGVKNGHAYYSSVREAVIDYAFMQASYYKNAKTEEDYYILLEKYYCKNNNYINILKQIEETLK